MDNESSHYNDFDGDLPPFTSLEDFVNDDIEKLSNNVYVGDMDEDVIAVMGHGNEMAVVVSSPASRIIELIKTFDKNRVVIAVPQRWLEMFGRRQDEEAAMNVIEVCRLKASQHFDWPLT